MMLSAGETAKVYECVTVRAVGVVASLIWMVKPNVPVVVGVPERVPLAERASAAGRPPEASDQL